MLGYIGIMEKDMEAIIWGLGSGVGVGGSRGLVFRVGGSGFRG